MTTNDKASPAPRPRGRPPQVEDRRQQIIECAFEEIAAKGLEGFRMREVATAANVDHSTVHHYFATKQDLLTAVVDFATRPLWGTTPREGSPPSRIRGHVAAQRQLIKERPKLLLVLREFDLRAARDAAIGELIASREAGWRRALASVFEAGKASGDWPASFASADAVELMIAAIKGASLSPKHAPKALAELERRLAPKAQKSGGSPKSRRRG